MPGTDTYLCLRAFVDELVRCGLRDACTSPGSRSTPLALTFARDSRLRSTSHIDERSGSFFGLGLAKATGIPPALVCTSGTAAANYAPAVHEAFEARVPLLVLTADRPPELRAVGAGQTIDQIGLYGRAAKWFFEVDDFPASPARVRWLRQLACRAFWTAVDGRPGPVHLNFSFREPLVPDGEAGVPDVDVVGGREGGRPWLTPARRSRACPTPSLIDDLVRQVGRRFAARGRRRAHRARPAARRGAGRVLRPRGCAAAGRSAVGRAPRTRRGGALRRAAAVPGVRCVRGAGSRACAWATCPTSKPLRAWLAGVVRAAGQLRRRDRVAGPGRLGRHDHRRQPARDLRGAHLAGAQAPRTVVARALARGGPRRRRRDRRRLWGRS